MSYKVDFYTLALMANDKPGNINQGSGVVYTDTEIETIPVTLNAHLKKDKKVGVITKITKVKGKCI